MRSATSTFLGHPSSVPQARRWAGATLGEWGLRATGWSAAQVVSELVTNSTLHARSDFTVRVQLDRACLRIEVEDRSPVPLQTRAYSPTSTTGRGLGIVDVLSVDWGVSTTTDGKTVWVLIAVEDADLLPTKDDADGQAAGSGERRSSAASGSAPAARDRGAA